MSIETEIRRKWGIGDNPVFGSGSIQDIQRLCNECSNLRKRNEILTAALIAAEKYIEGVNADWPKGMDSDRDELINRIKASRQ